MRADMKWILGDKRGSRLAGPRKGRRFSPAEFRKYDWDLDDTPFVGGYVGHALEKALIGSRRESRGLNDPPLGRYLSSRVGDDWDDVLSDISFGFRGTQIAEAHLPYLLTHFVALDVEMVGDRATYKNWRGASCPLSDQFAPKFYVDPRDRRLQRNIAIVTPRMLKRKQARELEKERAARMRDISPHKQLHLLADGNWWDVSLEPISSARARGQTRDVVLGCELSALPLETLYGRKGVWATDKRALSAKEMKRLRLR